MACCLFPYIDDLCRPLKRAFVGDTRKRRIVAADFDVAEFVRYVENLAASDFRHESPRNDRAIRQRPNKPAERRLYFLVFRFLPHNGVVNLPKPVLQGNAKNLGKERELL